MIITVAAFKGGVGKTTTAVHLAAFLQQSAKTILIDGDPNRSCTAWAARGALPFAVADPAMTARVAREYEHLVFDTAARPDPDELKVLAEGCDCLIIPTTADGLSLDALMLTVEALRRVEARRYRILVTMNPPKPSQHGLLAQSALRGQSLPVFETMIRYLQSFKTAGTTGVLVSDVKDPRARLGWGDYEAVGGELLDVLSGKAGVA